MEKTANETVVAKDVQKVIQKGRITQDPFTFSKDCMVTNFVKNEITDRDNPAAEPSYWYAVSVADGHGFSLKDVSASKNCRPWELATLKMYRVYFTVDQQPNKSGNGLRYVVKIVDYERIAE